MKRNATWRLEKPIYFKGKGGGGSSKTTQTTVPWTQQQPYLVDLFKRAQEQLDSSDLSYYPNSTVAPVNPLQTQAQNMALQTAMTQQAPFASNTAGANNFLLGPVLDPRSNPSLQMYGNYLTDTMTRAFNEDVLPQIRSGAVAAGQGGSTRQAIAEGIATDRFQQNLGGTLASLYNSAYGQGLDALTRGTALAPQTMGLMQMAPATVSAVGAEQRAFDQAALDDMVARWNFNQSAPWQELSQYAQLVTGGFGGTSTTEQPSAQSNPLLGAAGGALSGAALAQMLKMSTPWGAGIGALVGLL